ncbi:hypothetical protein IE81DRAFT_323413 [Ceraceosorus guamensis]|uniref:Actin-like ATPase domain-containing protein n=1 Tax=Ceraceosorus guamensis TaxID=1522189 RepID=A0A316VYB8_9BASI|nr:hypothetical protein IE81DRAFT_323413 [Ceraceosorus guamensis]PWN42449.1 hypothetical protein IE81DRAFT_323413 [Ceraceosorus guamensis]
MPSNGFGRESVSTMDRSGGSSNGHGSNAHASGSANVTGNNYNQYLADGSVAPRLQRRAGKDWLPYQGERQLIISIDLGTTYSGASYCILEPGKKPRIEDCRAYPGQASGLSKVPSVVTYDAEGNARFFGAEAEGPEADVVLDEGGSQIRWWKLHLKPAHLHVILAGDSNETTDQLDLDPLPPGVTAEQVCSTFLAYIIRCVGAYIFSRLHNGAEVLQTLGQNTSYIITTPCGWELQQQQVLRQACINAQLIPPERSDAIRFVTEAEASINYCAMSAAGDWLEKPGQHLIVLDAGGGTIDITTYEVTSVWPAIECKEVGVSDCIIGGSATVDHRAMLLIQDRLKGTRWDNFEDLRHLRQAFSEGIKQSFARADVEQILLPIGSSSESDSKIGLRRGKLVFTGKEIAELFEPSIKATVESIERRVEQCGGGAGSLITVAAVGGFSESEFYRNEVQRRLGNKVQLSKPDESTAKAVASGSLVWLIDGVVSSRVSRLDYGIKCATVYKPEKPGHVARRGQVYSGVDGTEHLPGAFGCVLRKGTSGRDDEEHISPFVLTWLKNVPCTAAISLYVYRGDEEGTEFVDEAGFEQLATFMIDMEPFRPLLKTCRSTDGGEYIRADVELAMRLNATEISAQCLFRHGGSLYRGPVSVAATHN